MTRIKHYPKMYQHLVNDFFNAFPAGWGKDAAEVWSSPEVNIFETEEAYHLEVNAPGRTKEHFGIQVEKGLLTITYQKEEATEKPAYKTLRREFVSGNFKRTFSLEDSIHTDGIQAKYENGILKIFLPKQAPQKSTIKSIQIA